MTSTDWKPAEPVCLNCGWTIEHHWGNVECPRDPKPKAPAADVSALREAGNAMRDVLADASVVKTFLSNDFRDWVASAVDAHHAWDAALSPSAPSAEKAESQVGGVEDEWEGDDCHYCGHHASWHGDNDRGVCSAVGCSCEEFEDPAPAVAPDVTPFPRKTCEQCGTVYGLDAGGDWPPCPKCAPRPQSNADLWVPDLVARVEGLEHLFWNHWHATDKREDRTTTPTVGASAPASGEPR